MEEANRRNYKAFILFEKEIITWDHQVFQISNMIKLLSTSEHIKSSYIY